MAHFGGQRLAIFYFFHGHIQVLPASVPQSQLGLSSHLQSRSRHGQHHVRTYPFPVLKSGRCVSEHILTGIVCIELVLFQCCNKRDPAVTRGYIYHSYYFCRIGHICVLSPENLHYRSLLNFCAIYSSLSDSLRWSNYVLIKYLSRTIISYLLQHYTHNLGQLG